MMRVLKNKRGTTLVELVVCMVLLSLFTLAAVTLIQPSAQAYMQVQQQTRAQNLADALIETIRGELLNANGYIRFADGATDSDLDTVFKEKTGVSSGTALEFSVYPNHIELIDKDKVPALTKADGTPLLTQDAANELDGYLHMRFYLQEENTYKPQHEVTSDGKNCLMLPTPTRQPTPRTPTWGCLSVTCSFMPAAIPRPRGKNTPMLRR